MKNKLIGSGLALSLLLGVPPAFRKKTTLRIFSIKRAVILRIKRLFYT
ncbi:hypothetical protein [Bacillus cereus group sp. MYBK209-1]